MPLTPEARAKGVIAAKAAREAKKAAKSLANVELQTAVAPRTEVGPVRPAEPTPKAPPRNLIGGMTKRLEVFGKAGCDPNDPIPGFVLCWIDDIQGGLFVRKALASGWVFVQADEVALNEGTLVPGNNDLGSGVRVDLASGHTYLMKKPNWLHELHETGPDSIEQKVHLGIEEQLRQGSLGQNPSDRPYTATNPYPGTRSGLPPIQMGRYYKPPRNLS